MDTFQMMKPEIKKEVRNTMVHETALDNDYEITTDMMTGISMGSFQEIWDAPENEHWNDFIKARLQCTNKEI